MYKTVKKIPKGCGVYQAVCKSGHYYIGRSVNMRHRVYQHIRLLKEGKHHNPKWQQVANKYGCDFQWSVLIRTSDAESAILYERHLLELYWNDKKLINLRKGDSFEAVENERKKRIPKYYMNVWTRQYIRLNYTTEWKDLTGHKIPQSVSAKTLEECYELQKEYMVRFIERNEKQFCIRKKKYFTGYHIRNIHTGYVGYAKDFAELKKIKAYSSLYSKSNSFANGWQVRKIGSDWSWFVPIVATEAVFGLHVTGKVKQWKSKYACERDLGHGVGAVFTGNARTYKGWSLRTDRGWPA